MELLTRNNFENWMQKVMERLDRQDEMLLSMQPSGKAPNPMDGIRLFDNQDLCMLLQISKRTLQRYRQKHIIPYSMIGRQIRYPRQAVESLRERWMVETPAAKIDRMIAEHPLHNRKNGSYGKKGRSAGKNQ